IGSAAIMVAVINDTYAIEQWLFPICLQAWAFVLLFHAACLSIGWAITKALLDATPPIHERFVLSHAVGVLTFYLSMFAAGLLDAYSAPLSWCLPTMLLGMGLPSVLSDWRRWRSKRRQLVAQALIPSSWRELLCLVVMAVGALGIYLQILTPENISFDSHWYHLPIAQHYVAAGGIRRFDEGWYLGAYPHLSSFFYTWALLSPGSFFAKVTLCSHLEYSFLPMLVIGVSALVQRLLGEQRHWYAGVAIFLFPSLFIYDSSFTTNADHILAFWVAPMTIALIRLGKRFVVREAVLSASLAAAAACTKYQSCMLLVPVFAYLGYLMVRHRKITPVLAWGAIAGAVTSTHWLKNLVFYHDPLYPLMHDVMPSRPFHAGAAQLLNRIYWDHYYLPEGKGWGRVRNVLTTIVMFPFVHDGKLGLATPLRPVHGMLFTLLVPTIPFVRKRRNLLALVIAVCAGVAIWYLTSHQDRYLQALLPWMAAFVAAMMIQLWRTGAVVTRVGLVILVCTQGLIVANGYFTPNHTMAHDSALRATAEYLGKSYKRDYANRFVVDPTMEKLHAALPAKAKVLGHSMSLRLGLLNQTIMDGAGWQGAIEYLDLNQPDRVASEWRSLGATHVIGRVEPKPPNAETMVRDLVYARTVDLFGARTTEIDGWQVYRLLERPISPERATQATRVGWLVCERAPALGIYATTGFGTQPALSTPSSEALRNTPLDALAEANGLVVQPTCEKLPSDLTTTLPREFKRVANLGAIQLWIRT
ncbi:MAG TPA: hypothetical protein VIV60_07655, partial [Polyangiaceae bacterium]